MSRDKSIDIAKGIGIILVVMGHAGVPHSTIIFRFHMALFFILSGWCFSDKYLQDYKSILRFIWRRIKGLYFPFVVFNTLTTLLRDFLINVNIYILMMKRFWKQHSGAETVMDCLSHYLRLN